MVTALHRLHSFGPEFASSPKIEIGAETLTRTMPGFLAGLSIMNVPVRWESLLIIAPILGLLVVGFAIVAYSGVASLRTGQGLRLVASNLSSAFFRVVGYLACLLALDQLLRTGILPGW